MKRNDLIVADYFAMLADDIFGRRYSKAEHRRAPPPAAERPVRGVRRVQAPEYQRGAEGARRGLDPRLQARVQLPDDPGGCRGAVAGAEPGLAQAPTWPATRRRFARSGADLDRAAADAVEPAAAAGTGADAPHRHKFDVAGRDERNRALGRAGEERVLAHERAALRAAGRDDLARKVRWVSEEDGDGAGYDIASFGPDGRARLIEVKTTNGWERTPFHITRNELAVAEERRSEWRLFRLWNFSREPKAFELHPPLDAHVSLTATTFQASFH